MLWAMSRYNVSTADDLSKINTGVRYLVKVKKTFEDELFYDR